MAPPNRIETVWETPGCRAQRAAQRGRAVNDPPLARGRAPRGLLLRGRPARGRARSPPHRRPGPARTHAREACETSIPINLGVGGVWVKFFFFPSAQIHTREARLRTDQNRPPRRKMPPNSVHTLRKRLRPTASNTPFQLAWLDPAAGRGGHCRMHSVTLHPSACTQVFAPQRQASGLTMLAGHSWYL